ncbi:uncharacterized protein LOC143036996 [Oratosquilla oratoria]|uniref:uncharacterized protein LOC143036996 n=1 Tax=Oratosquilla oratoria TaxID=337810 RepID=UPI003F775C49
MPLMRPREIDLKELFFHELAPVATSMFEDNGDMTITKSKFTLKQKLQVEQSSRTLTITENKQSTDEFIDVLKSNNPVGIMVSLDAHSLFTNIPVLRTTDIILDYVYHHPVLPPPRIPKNVMKKMLLACTTKAPFKCSQSKLFVQIDGVAMGSPLGGPLCSTFKSYVENEALHSLTTKPHLYLRSSQDPFEALQRFMSTEPVLRTPDYSRPFVLQIYAS